MEVYFVMDAPCVKCLPGETECKWHKSHSQEGHVYTADEIFPGNFCPIMYHTLYPYFLGALFGAKYGYRKGKLNSKNVIILISDFLLLAGIINFK